MDLSVARRDIGLSLFIIAVCIAVLIESWHLPPGTFEPLGSGPVPQAIAFTIIGLCLIMLVRAGLALARGREREKTEADLEAEAEEAASGFHPRPWSAFLVLLLSCVYIGVLYLGFLGFGLVSTVYLFVVIVFLMGAQHFKSLFAFVTTRDRQHLEAARPVFIALAIAVLMGYGCEYIFTEIFYVDLPTG